MLERLNVCAEVWKGMGTLFWSRPRFQATDRQGKFRLQQHTLYILGLVHALEKNEEECYAADMSVQVSVCMHGRITAGVSLQLTPPESNVDAT